MAPQLAENEANEIRFFVATQTLKPQNQIHMVDFDDATSILKQKVFPHPDGEIWKLNCSPHDVRTLLSCYSTVKSSQVVMRTAIHRLPDFSATNDNKELFNFETSEVLDTDSFGSIIRTTEFNKSDANSLATVVDDKILLHARTEAKTRVVAEINAKNSPKFTTGKWSEHHQGNQFIALIDCSVRSYDIRDPNNCAWSIDDAHTQTVRDLDCNPNKHCHFVTGGDDGAVKIWDSRFTKEAVFVRNDHQHWFAICRISI